VTPESLAVSQGVTKWHWDTVTPHPLGGVECVPPKNLKGVGVTTDRLALQGIEPMPHDRSEYVCDVTSVILECQSMMQAVSLQPTVSELLGMSRLVLLREAEARRFELVNREPTVN
jgi:hypothetical protein